MTKRAHQIFFGAIIINLILVLIFSDLSSFKFILSALSLFAMLILPLGKKGGSYHVIVSSLGIILYSLIIFIAS